MAAPKLKNLLHQLEQLDYQYINESEALNMRLQEFQERLRGLRLPVTASADFPVPPNEANSGVRRRLVYGERDGQAGLWIAESRPGAPEAEWTPLLKGPAWVRKIAPRLFGAIVQQMVEQAERMVAGVSGALAEAERVLDDFGNAA